ncbi:DUF1345 domain-containing protein [Microbacterium sp.]|uniref:DUF1345 domain-containing protein n=1 Tax=Microbacterium sp. TaxID=51671 RepID=UPI0025FDC294|nr:DUF1345 domain-containing protein [Microbacterium sp.]
MTIVRRFPILLRGLVSLAVGVALALAAGSVLGGAAGLLVGWSGAALTSVVWILVVTWPMDGPATRAHATREDPGRSIARVIAVSGSLVSLTAVAIVLIQTRDADPVRASVLAAVAVVAVASSWALIQADYMLRYAHLYFADPVGGIDFHQDTDPCYADFGYFSVGLGMTYQVADTDVSTTGLRRVVIAQTLLAYLFGAVILATVINLIAGLG